MREWLCVARAEEVANAGDYLTFRLMNEPFVVARAAPVFDEDTGIVTDAQEAVSLNSYQPGPLSRVEASIHHTFTHYLDRIFDA